MIEFFAGREEQLTSHLALLIVTFTIIFIIPLFPHSIHSVLYSTLLTCLFFIAIFTVNKYQKEIFIAAILMAILEWTSDFIDLSVLIIISKTVKILFFTIMVILLLLQVAKSIRVNLKVIIEAINVYLLLGLVFSFLIAFVMLFDPQAFRFPPSEFQSDEANAQLIDSIYYGFVTFTTLGYGDVVPLKPYAKSLSTLTSVTGQIYIAVVIAMLVGKFSGSDSRKHPEK